MAYGIISSPGTAAGPCVEACEHNDCAESRETAGATCHVCREPVGYGVKFTIFGQGPAHWLCAIKVAEAPQECSICRGTHGREVQHACE